MIIKKGMGYIIEHARKNNNGGGSNPIVTRVILNDGFDIVEIYGSHLPASKIHVDVKTRTDISWLKKIQHIMNFDFKQVWDMPISEARKFIYSSIENSIEKEIKQ